MVKSFHDQGYVFEWTVLDPHIEATCDLAWITYSNRGSITTPGSAQDKPATHQVTWLESAVLQKTSRNLAHPLLSQHSRLVIACKATVPTPIR